MILLLGSTTFVRSATLHVIETYPGTPSGSIGSTTNPYTGSAGIQDAIDHASSGDTIKVAGGTYDSIEFPVASPSVDLHVIADNDWTQYGSGDSIIDGTGTNSIAGVYIWGGQTSATVLYGFTIQNFSGTVACAIRIHPEPHSVNGVGSSPSIKNCLIQDNCTNTVSNYGGAGIQIGWNCHPTVEDCTFINNVIGCGSGTDVGYGGAIWIYGASIGSSDCDAPEEGEAEPPDPLIINCVFLDNHATNNDSGAGGAIAITCGKATILNCEFDGNTATRGGGAIYCRLCDGTLVKGCEFYANEGTKGGAVYLQSFAAEDDWERVHLIDNLYLENLAPDYIDSMSAQHLGHGAAIYVENKNVTISHSIFEGNIGESGAAALYISSTRGTSGSFDAYVFCNLFGKDNDFVATHDRYKAVIYLEQAVERKLATLFTNNTVAGNTNLRAITLNNPSTLNPMIFTCYNSILYENTGSLSNSSILDYLSQNSPATIVVGYTNADQEVFSGSGNRSADPEFVGSGDFRFDSGSVCRDSGSNNLWSPNVDAEILTTDLDGHTRITNGTIDMGCFEYN